MVEVTQARSGLKARSVTAKLALLLPAMGCTSPHGASDATQAQNITHTSEEPTMPTTQAPSRYYQLVFLWMKDPATFNRYLAQAAPVVARYGGALERSVQPDTVYGEGITKPDVVNVVYYDSRHAYRTMVADPDFVKASRLRKASIDMVSVEGPAIAGRLEEGTPSERLYLVEIARFGPDGADGYRRYEQEAEAVMRPHGYHVERVIQPETSAGLPFEPDVVKVAYFDQQDGMERMHADPAHARIETETYPGAVAESVWLFARVPSDVEGPRSQDR